MAKYGYARVSSDDQSLDVQQEQLRAAGCDVVRGEHASGASRDGRGELALLLQFLRAGDRLVVTRVDRLARSLADLQDLMRELKAKGVTLEATEQRIDTGTSGGKAFLDMLGVFAEFETNLRRERQMEGIAKAKARGVYKGRPAKIRADRISELLDGGMTPTEVAREMGIGRASVYRVLSRSTPLTSCTTRHHSVDEPAVTTQEAGI